MWQCCQIFIIVIKIQPLFGDHNYEAYIKHSIQCLLTLLLMWNMAGPKAEPLAQMFLV